MKQHLIYFVVRRKKVVYIGYSTNLANRFKQHRFSKYDYIRWIVCQSRDCALRNEQRWIRRFRPSHNGIHGEQPKGITKKTIDIPTIHMPAIEKAACISGDSVKAFMQRAVIAATIQTINQ